jgi:hypothetical protein
MRRLIILTVLAAGMLLAMRKKAKRGGLAMGERCSEMCDRMLVNMPESFPPNRMMADLETLKEQTARILEKLEEPEEVAGPQG